jgi:hypothetical protein
MFILNENISSHNITPYICNVDEKEINYSRDNVNISSF